MVLCTHVDSKSRVLDWGGRSSTERGNFADFPSIEETLLLTAAIGSSKRDHSIIINGLQYTLYDEFLARRCLWGLGWRWYHSHVGGIQYPQITPSGGPIPKPKYLPHPRTPPTYHLKRHPYPVPILHNSLDRDKQTNRQADKHGSLESLITCLCVSHAFRQTIPVISC